MKVDSLSHNSRLGGRIGIRQVPPAKLSLSSSQTQTNTGDERETELVNREKGLSDFWRHDRSDDRVQELASVLQGADILIGNMGSDIQVTWSGRGVSCTDFQRRIVALDYRPLKEQDCPFPGLEVDEVIGYAAHEGGHCLWSIPGGGKVILQQINTRWSALPPSLQEDWQAGKQTVLKELCRIQNLLEDAHVDYRIARRWPVLGSYIQIARRKFNERIPTDVNAMGMDAHHHRNALINLWAGLCLYGYPLPSCMSIQLKQTIASLLDLTEKAIEEQDATARQIIAVDAAIVLWQNYPTRKTQTPILPQGEIQGVPQQKNMSGSVQLRQEGTANGSASYGDGSQVGEVKNLDDFDPFTGFGQSGRQVVQVPEELLKRLDACVAHEEDFSRSVAQALAEDPRQTLAKAKKADYDPDRARKVISQVQREIGEIHKAFRHQRSLKGCWLHGLEHGKIDERRLLKPFVGGTGYHKRKDAVGRHRLAIGLLLDVSGSMSKYMHIVEQTAAVFCQGLMHMVGVNLAVWCYAGQSTRVMLTSLYDRQLPGLCLANVEQGGRTPSGAAIAVSKILMERMPEKRKLLIHFTDAQPDSVDHVARAVRSCAEANIRVYAIGLSHFQESLQKQYSRGNYTTIKTVSELPQAVARMLKNRSALQ